MPTSQIPEVGNRWNSHWNSRLENGPFLGIPGNSHTEGSVHTEGVLLHTEGGVFWRLLPIYHQLSYTPRIGSPFAIVVVGAAAIRASLAFEERRHKETAHDASLKSPIDTI